MGRIPAPALRPLADVLTLAIEIEVPQPTILRMSGKSWDAEIFAAGNWDGSGGLTEFTVDDLQKIAANFQTLREVHKPPLKFGHDEEQNLLGQSDGDPAIGWVSNLKVVGQKLVATFSDVPSKVWDLIQANRYRKVSAEIYQDVKFKGNPIGPVLRAVALLGADIPAVSSLADLHALMMSQPSAKLEFSNALAFSTANPNYSGQTPMPDIKDAVSREEFLAFQENQKKREEELQGELKKYREREAELLSQARAEKYVQAKSSVITKANDLVKAGKLAPALRDKLEVFCIGQEKKFSEETGLQVPAEWVMSLFAEMTPVMKKGVNSKDPSAIKANPLGGDEEKDAGAELAMKAKKLFTEHPDRYKTIESAQRAVMEIEPELARKYAEQVRAAVGVQVDPETLQQARES